MPPFLTDKRTLTAICIVAILVSLVSLISGRHSGQPSIDPDLHRTAGRVFAEETMKTLTGSGQFVLVVPVCRATRLRAIETQVDAFEKTLKELGRGRILAREQVDASTPQVDDLFTPELYFRLVRKYPNVNAIICFSGIKSFGEADLTEAAGKPPVCVFSMSEPVQKELVDQGIVKLAVVPRGWKQDESAQDAAPQANGFNNFYAIVRP